MKKTLIASAVAAAALSSNAFAMDQASDLAEMLESMPTIYGNIQLVNNTNDTDGESNTTFEDNGSTLGFKHDSAISDDVTAFFKAEFHFDADEAGNNSLGEKLDESYIGVKGGFGSIQIGSDDTVYEWVDHVDIEEFEGQNSDVAGMAEGDNLQYVSPEIGEGLEIGITLPLDLDGADEFNMAVAANYSAVENLSLTLAYANGRDDSESALGLAGTYTMGDLALKAQYETQKDDADIIALQGVYSMGANQFALGYSLTSADIGDEEQTDIYLQALHNLSDNMYVYLEYVTTSYDENDAADNEDLSIGATYAF